MDPEDLLARAPDDPLRLLVTQDLDRLSIAELDARIAALEGEIARSRAKRDGSAAFRSVADQLFSKSSAKTG